MHRIVVVLLALVLVTGCNTEKAADEQAGNQSMEQQMQGPPPKRDISDATLIEIDPQIGVFVEKVDKIKAEYEAASTDENKTKLVNAYIAFGDYMQYESPVSPRKGKYHRALVEYRHALNLDPHSQKAMEEIQQIEGIYRSMGRAIPGEEV